MKNKSHKIPRKPILQTCELVPITDPAVQAALVDLFAQEKPVVPKILRDYAKAQSRKSKKRPISNGRTR